MADHVAVGVVADDEIKAVLLDGVHQNVRDRFRAHLRGEVVGGDGRGGYEFPRLSREDLLFAAVKEEGDVGVFLRFRHPQLPQSRLADHFPEGVFEPSWRIGTGGRQAFGVARQGDEGGEGRGFLSREAVEGRVQEGLAQLPGAVGAEIHEDHRVPIVDGAFRASAPGGVNEFIRFIAGIGFGQGLGRAGGLASGAFREERIGLGDPIPALVPVHGVVAPHDAGHPTHPEAFQRLIGGLEGGFGGARGRIPAVEKGVDIDALGAPGRGGSGHGQDMVLVAVYAAGGQKAKQVHRAPRGPRGIHGAHERRILRQLARGGVLINACEFLEDDPARPQVHVPHFRIAHLPFREPHGEPRAVDEAVGRFGPEPIPGRGLGQGNGIVGPRRRVAKAVENDEQGRARRHERDSPKGRLRVRLV